MTKKKIFYHLAIKSLVNIRRYYGTAQFQGNAQTRVRDVSRMHVVCCDTLTHEVLQQTMPPSPRPRHVRDVALGHYLGTELYSIRAQEDYYFIAILSVCDLLF